MILVSRPNHKADSLGSIEPIARALSFEFASFARALPACLTSTLTCEPTMALI